MMLSHCRSVRVWLVGGCHLTFSEGWRFTDACGADGGACGVEGPLSSDSGADYRAHPSDAANGSWAFVPATSILFMCEAKTPC